MVVDMRHDQPDLVDVADDDQAVLGRLGAGARGDARDRRPQYVA